MSVETPLLIVGFETVTAETMNITIVGYNAVWSVGVFCMKGVIGRNISCYHVRFRFE